MPCLPPLLLTGRRYVSRLLRDIDAVLSRTSTYRKPIGDKDVLALPRPVAAKQAEQDSAGEEAHEDPIDDIVCQECREGLFAPQSFQQAWTSSGLHEGYSYTATWTQVQVSAERGCQWCKMVYSMKTDVMEKQRILQVTASVRHCADGDNVSPRNLQTLRLTVNGTHSSDYYVYADRDDPAAEQIVARSPVLQVRSPLARTLAAERISDCVRNHRHCPAPTDAALPTRVVDCSDPARPKLRLRNGERARYVALSYVAGPPQPPTSPLVDAFGVALAPAPAADSHAYADVPASPSAFSAQSHSHSQPAFSRPTSPTPSAQTAHSYFSQRPSVPGYATTTRNVHAHRAGIDAMRLPRTLRDAIMTTHLLGVQYLWVDALCVLQDSPEDRAREAARVRSVFRNAYFTIIAASAHGVGEGFLQDRAPPAVDVRLPFNLPPAGADGAATKGAMWLSPACAQYDGDTEPIHQRAWCLEERLLSPRALVYTSQTLQFHCQSGVTNIGDAVCVPPPPVLPFSPPGSRPASPTPSTASSLTPTLHSSVSPLSAYDAHWQRLPDELFLADADLPVPPSVIPALQHAWARAVSAYTARAVTNSADKLLAFAAVAEAFHRVWRTDYLAGLWRAALPRDLLWRKDPTTRFLRPECYGPGSAGSASSHGHGHGHGHGASSMGARGRAPTWSWAAVDGRVIPLELTPEGRLLDAHALALADAPSFADSKLDGSGGTVDSCEVLACAVAPASTSAPFGRVAPGSGALVLRAVARRATWTPAAEAPTPLLLRVSGPRQVCVGLAYPDAVELAREDGSHACEPERAAAAAVWAVPVLWNARAQVAAGLVLAPLGDADGDHTGWYRRVGFFHTPEGSPGGLAWMDQPTQDITII